MIPAEKGYVSFNSSWLRLNREGVFLVEYQQTATITMKEVLFQVPTGNTAVKPGGSQRIEQNATCTEQPVRDRP